MPTVEMSYDSFLVRIGQRDDTPTLPAAPNVDKDARTREAIVVITNRTDRYGREKKAAAIANTLAQMSVDETREMLGYLRAKNQKLMEMADPSNIKRRRRYVKNDCFLDKGEWGLLKLLETWLARRTKTAPPAAESVSVASLLNLQT